jgi:hypothetical protein
MRTVLVAALVAALVCLGILSFWPRPSPPVEGPTIAALQQQLADVRQKIRQRPADVAVILLQVGAECRSQTLPRGYAYREQTVRWFVFNINCNLGDREVELRFTDDDTPLDVRRPRHRRFIVTRVRPDARVGAYKYALWAVGAGGDYQLEDPELEIAEF